MRKKVITLLLVLLLGGCGVVPAPTPRQSVFVYRCVGVLSGHADEIDDHGTRRMIPVTGQSVPYNIKWADHKLWNVTYKLTGYGELPEGPFYFVSASVCE